MAEAPLVWIDCEMTGLNPEVDALVEVACIVTDAELNPLGEGVTAVIKPSDEAVAGMNDFVRSMHEKSGLLDRLPHGTTMAAAQELVLNYVRQHAPVAGKALLAGNTVGMDKQFLERNMPELTEHLHYRIVDVSTIKELARRWYPRTFFQAPAKTGGHRALGDIEDSIRELRYYREAIFVDQPGPDSDSAKAISQSVSKDAK